MFITTAHNSTLNYWVNIFLASWQWVCMVDINAMCVHTLLWNYSNILHYFYWEYSYCYFAQKSCLPHFVVFIHSYFFKKFCSVYAGGWGGWRCSCALLTLALGRDWVIGGKTVWCPFQRILIGLLSIGIWWQRDKSLPLPKTKPWSWVNWYIVVFDRKIK
jgi:hypothetical protein